MTHTSRPRALSLASSFNTSSIDKIGLPSFVIDLNSVPMDGVLSNDEYSPRFSVGRVPLALRVRPPTACLSDSIVCVAVEVAVATGAILIARMRTCSRVRAGP